MQEISEPLAGRVDDKRWTGRQYLLCAAIFAVLAVLALTVDIQVKELALRFSKADIPGDLRRALTLSEVFAHGSGVLMCIAIPVVLDPRGWRVIPRLAIGSYGAGLLVNLLKLNVARIRPRYSAALTVQETFVGWLPWRDTSQLPEAWGHNLESFPSGHTGTAVGLAIALTSLYPRGRWLFTLFAATAALQRIDSGMHYLSDTLAAAAIGFLVGAAICGKTRLATWLEKLESVPKANEGTAAE